MRLVYIFAAILAVSVAESDKDKYEDLEAMETMELKKEGVDLTPQASVYNYIPPSQRPPKNWNQNYVPQNQPQNYIPPQPIQPINPPYVPPVTASPPYVPPVQSDYVPSQGVYYPQNTWSTPHYHVPTTTTPVAVIKNEQYYGDNGSYKYEYQIADGTHVGEEGYFTDPKATDESLVKKGWYSYMGADGKTYTVTYWADKTGYHAFGDHLPTPPPVPPAIQAALDKEEAEKNKQPTYPTQTQKPVYYPQYDPVYNPPQQPSYNPPQQTYYPPQQTYYPPQQTYYPSQQQPNNPVYSK